MRHGLMVVGPTGGGKSSNLKVLKEALSTLHSSGVKGTRYAKVGLFSLRC